MRLEQYCNTIGGGRENAEERSSIDAHTDTHSEQRLVTFAWSDIGRLLWMYMIDKER